MAEVGPEQRKKPVEIEKKYLVAAIPEKSGAVSKRTNSARIRSYRGRRFRSKAERSGGSIYADSKI